MKDGSDYAFSFRNPLEAEIFLSRNGINANQQVELLCEILRVYQEHWEELPSSFARNLQQLIRLMGPNSQYTAFRENGEKRQEHSDILRQSEKIVQLSIAHLLADAIIRIHELRPLSPLFELHLPSEQI